MRSPRLTRGGECVYIKDASCTLYLFFMTNSPHLAKHELCGNAELPKKISIPPSTGNPVLDANLFDLAQRFCGNHRPEVILNLLANTMNAAHSELSCADLEMMACTLSEMYQAEKLFLPYQHRRKVTCFGSARTKSGSPTYEIAKRFAALVHENGHMVITGGGPGIMQACNEGASEESSFGLNITLPFEQAPNPIMAGSNKMMDFYYFFTRKLNLIKQTDALVAFPGGFGTMDEVYESITLMQTGKSLLFPVVLLDAPGDFFWQRWLTFIKKELLEEGLISSADLDLIYLTKSAEDAYEHILHFYHRFHSYYFEGNQITIRINHKLDHSSLRCLQADYRDLNPLGDLAQLDNDPKDPDSKLQSLPRLCFTHSIKDYARLRLMINDIND